MNIKNEKDYQENIPVFATTSGAACYKVGDEVFMDLMFLRSHFVIDGNTAATDINGPSGIQEQRAEMIFTKVAAVTMTAQQAKDLVRAVEHQLSAIESN